MTKKPTAKPRSPKPAPTVPEGGPRASEEYVPLIKPKKLKDLLKSDGSYRDDISELTGRLREAIANAVNNDHLDKNAFALLKKFSKMKPEKRAILWREFIAYMKICGLLADIEARMELPLGEEPPTSATDEPDAGSESPGSRRAPQFGGTVAQMAQRAGAQVPGE